MSIETVVGPFADALFMAKRLAVGPYRARRTRFYCVGSGKSGTHSIARMFARPVRSRHEAEAVGLIDKVLAWQEGRLGEKEFTEWLLERDRRLALEVDSSLVNVDILDFLLREFPDGRYLLTIRDCYSWLNSQVNHALTHGHKADPLWAKLGQLRDIPDARVYAPEERVLEELGFSNVDNYLRRWTSRNMQVIEKVPADKLMIVRTDEITRRAYEIADFAGLPRRAVRLERSHAFQNTSKRNVILEIDRDFLEAKVEKHCRPLMKRFFPEIKSLNDVKL